jgi:hypothetical protein
MCFSSYANGPHLQMSTKNRLICKWIPNLSQIICKWTSFANESQFICIWVLVCKWGVSSFANEYNWVMNSFANEIRLTCKWILIHLQMSLNSFANKDSFAYKFWLICKRVISHLQTIRWRLPTRVPTRATPRGCLRNLLIQWNWTINKWLFTPTFIPSDCWDNWLALLFNTPFLPSDCLDNILALLFNTLFLPSDCWDNWLVLPPVQLYGALAILPRMTPYKQHGTHLWCWGGCACVLVAMVLQEQRFWGQCQWKVKNAKTSRKNQWSSPLSNCMVHHQYWLEWCPTNGMALTCDAEEAVLMIWWQWWCKTVVLGRCQLEVKNAE